jgi:hypothetical protein
MAPHNPPAASWSGSMLTETVKREPSGRSIRPLYPEASSPSRLLRRPSAGRDLLVARNPGFRHPCGVPSPGATAQRPLRGSRPDRRRPVSPFGASVPIEGGLFLPSGLPSRSKAACFSLRGFRPNRRRPVSPLRGFRPDLHARILSPKSRGPVEPDLQRPDLQELCSWLPFLVRFEWVYFLRHGRFEGDAAELVRPRQRR